MTVIGVYLSRSCIDNLSIPLVTACMSFLQSSFSYRNAGARRVALEMISSLCGFYDSVIEKIVFDRASFILCRSFLIDSDVQVRGVAIGTLTGEWGPTLFLTTLRLLPATQRLWR